MRCLPPEELPGQARRPGTVLVMFAVCSIMLIGLVALVIDGGLAQAERIRVQAIADAAALAGACQLYRNYPTDGGLDVDGSAASGARAIAADNGLTNDGTLSTVVVNIPPASGLYAGLAGYVEVVITARQGRYFSNIWSSGALYVRARTVARGAWVPFAASLLALDPSFNGAVNVQGNGSITGTGAQGYINSNSSSALTTGSNGTVHLSAVDVTGGTSGGGISGTVTTGVHPMPDPLAYLPAPGETGGPAIPSAQTVITTSLGGGVFQYDLYPGAYAGLPTFGSNNKVIFHQASSNSNGGIFYLSSGGFHSTQNVQLSMAAGETGGLMIYNAGTGAGDTISIAGNGSVSLGRRTEGPYAGMVLFQSRASTGDVSIAGNGSFSVTGTVYTPAARLNLSGNGSAAVIGSQWIGKRLYLSGNGSLKFNYSSTTVARTRIIAIME